MQFESMHFEGDFEDALVPLPQPVSWQDTHCGCEPLGLSHVVSSVLTSRLGRYFQQPRVEDLRNL